ncbi:MAG TPA: EAL domain-containing protein [Thermoanaerobaculia bacterium]|nr:EAL domain-containing protein [Thermoanaerobaculia bacterium]
MGERLLLAADSGELLLYYQPQIDLRSGAVVGAEALMRWEHPDRGLLLPIEFLPQVLNSAVMHRLTQWVIESAIDRQLVWRKEGLCGRVAVNVSPATIHNTSFPDWLARTLESRRLPASELTIEITEDAYLGHPLLTAHVLGRLAELGVRISIDDFGAGYSSLVYLRDFPISELKIDHSFVSVATRCTRSQRIIRALVDLAGELGIDSLAEGVEDKATRDLMLNLGCPTAQGFYLAVPVPAGEAAQIFATS